MTALEELEPDSSGFRLDCPQLATPRLVLRRPVLDDAHDIAFLANNRKIAAMVARMPYPYGLADARAFITRNSDGGPNGCVYAITMAATGRFIGCAGLNSSKGNGLELGYWLGEPFWGQGYATEAAHSLVDLAFCDNDMEQIHAACRLSSPASRRVIQKSGFQHSGSGMINSISSGSVTVERFVLDRKTWASLRTWGALSLNIKSTRPSGA